jgi:hypothetical protein
MKFNKWTLGLAAVGAVSMASTVRADEAAPKLTPVETALSSTVLSGYVDVAAQYNAGNYGPGAVVPAGTGSNTGGSKVDAFSLNDVDIALDKAQDESPWAAGYHIDLNAGTQAVGLGLGQGTQPTAASGTAAFALRQAYIVLRTPVGNGIDWKIGVQDDIIGYEGNTDGGNPNYSRSIGYSVEPTTLLGLIGSYKIVDAVTVQAGIVDATSPLLSGFYSNPQNFGSPASSDKTFAGAITFTAPDSFGWAKGASLNLGALVNPEKGGQYNYYAGLTIPTPISALKLGAAADLVSVNNAGFNAANSIAGNSNTDSGWILGLYASVQATDKLSFNLRGEFYDLEGAPFNPYVTTDGKGEEVTATIQYNLWANVISRLEFRWDHSDAGTAFANGGADADSFLLAANLIYTF